jgi:hypothetical protein
MSHRHRYDFVGSGHFSGGFSKSGGGSMPLTQYGKQSTADLEYMNNPANFTSTSSYVRTQKLLAEGREANAQGNYSLEASKDRGAQDVMKNGGSELCYTDEGSIEAFAWNSAWIHNEALLAEMYDNGKTFDDSFYYDKKDGRYYLTPDALQWTKSEELTDLYADKGVRNIVAPSGNKINRKMSRSSGGFTQSGGGVPNSSGFTQSEGGRSTHSSYPNMARYGNKWRSICDQSYTICNQTNGRTFGYNHPSVQFSSSTQYSSTNNKQNNCQASVYDQLNIGIELTGHSTPLQSTYVKPPNKTRDGYKIRSDGYVSHPTKESYHYQTGKTYNSNLSSTQQGHAVNPNEPVYYSMDLDLSMGEQYNRPNQSSTQISSQQMLSNESYQHKLKYGRSIEQQQMLANESYQHKLKCARSEEEQRKDIELYNERWRQQEKLYI